MEDFPPDENGGKCRGRKVAGGKRWRKKQKKGNIFIFPPLGNRLHLEENYKKLAGDALALAACQ
jgi:hypothetical protein